MGKFFVFKLAYTLFLKKYLSDNTEGGFDMKNKF